MAASREGREQDRPSAWTLGQVSGAREPGRACWSMHIPHPQALGTAPLSPSHWTPGLPVPPSACYHHPMDRIGRGGAGQVRGRLLSHCMDILAEPQPLPLGSCSP